jgi:multiple sugar transport system permease protein
MTSGSTGRTLRSFGKRAAAVLVYALAVIVLFVWTAPILWMLLSAFKPTELITGTSLSLWFTPTLEHFRFIFAKQQFLRYMVNSSVVALLATSVATFAGVMAAYAARRFGSGGRSFTFLVLLVRMLPGVVLAVPYFIVFSKLQLLNTLPALAFAHIGFTVPFVVWLMLGYVDDIPEALEEAAMVDGSSRVQAFFRIVLPLMRPGLAATAILAIIQSWNEFVYASVLTWSDSAKTLPVAAADFVTAYSVLWGPMFAAGAIIVIPVFLFTLTVQRQIIRGLTFGSVM